MSKILPRKCVVYRRETFFYFSRIVFILVHERACKDPYKQHPWWNIGAKFPSFALNEGNFGIKCSCVICTWVSLRFCLKLVSGFVVFYEFQIVVCILEFDKIFCLTLFLPFPKASYNITDYITDCFYIIKQENIWMLVVWMCSGVTSCYIGPPASAGRVL